MPGRFRVQKSEATSEFAPQRALDEWTIIDGGVRRGEFIELPRTLGVAKSFDRTPTFTVRKGNKGTIRKDISGLLAGLQYGCRTVAFFAHGAKVAFWYVRLPAIASLVPDYSLLNRVDWEYYPRDAFFVRVTKGCIRHCKFCAVPILEKQFGMLSPLRQQIVEARKHYGEKQHLVVMDNNILGIEGIRQACAPAKSCSTACTSTVRTTRRWRI